MGAIAEQLEGENVGRGAFTWRSVLLGLLMCIVISVADPYWVFYLHSSTLFLDYSVGGAMFFLLVLVLLFNGFVGVLWKRAALSSGELVVVMAMMMVAGAITTMGLVGYLVPNITAPYYLADNVNKWEEKLWLSLPKWAAPLDPGGRTDTIMRYYNGMWYQMKRPEIWSGSWSPAGIVGTWTNFVKVTTAMPWKPWIKPLLTWSIFLVGLYGCMISLMAIIRKQWVDYERLSFPIAQVPQELCVTAAAPWGPASVFRRRMFWFGFALPTIAMTLTALHKFHTWAPLVPINTSIYDFGPIRLAIRLSWAVLGFTFLIPNQVAFSIWSLNLASFAFRSTLKKYGLEMQENLGLYGAVSSPIMAHQGMGAMIVFTLSSLYFARHHLKKVLLCAFGVGAKGYDDGEASSYGTALLVLIVSTLIMLGWLICAGLSPFYSVVFVGVAMLIFYGLTRVVAQCGVSVTIAPMIAPVYITSTFGGAHISATGIAVLTQGWTWCSDIRTTVMSSAIHGMYMARKKANGMLFWLIVSALVTFVIATLATVWLGYRYGGANLHGWFFIYGPPYTFNWGLNEVSTASGPNMTGHFWTLLGAGIMGLLIVAHRSFFWWPIHPVGFIICSVDWTNELWFSIFLAWMFKAIITKVAGNRGVRHARRFFLGMILGQFTVAGVWSIIDTITQTTDNSIFWI